MQLSKENLKNISPLPDLSIPGKQLLELPEKVLQFGTGVLLRGLPDYFIDKANKQGIFNGRIVVVKSTTKGGTEAFDKQNGLYTLCIKGIEENKIVEETIINASVSRVLSASEEWKEILKCAHNPEIQIIISNTTESGIVSSDDKINDEPPPSFPGKLLAFLYERYKAFKGNNESGMVIVPTELITDNGNKLFSVVTELATKNKLGDEFIEWLGSSNYFCNSLVDRIVPGKLSATDQERTEQKLGYSDELMIMAEPFRLWAIELHNEKVKAILSFYRADDGVIITPIIEKYRELKLRLLNGTHSFCCGLAVLAGFGTVKDAMDDEQVLGFARRLMMLEIAQSLDNTVVSYNEACAFANKVIDRFRNPFLQHKWLSIAVNYTSKMRMRNISLLVRHFEKTGKVPENMALGFAAYLLFMKCRKNSDGNYYGQAHHHSYTLEDEAAGYFSEQWMHGDTDKLVEEVLANEELWGTDLSALNGFSQAVKEYIRIIQKEGVLAAINSRQLQQTTA